MNPPMCKLLTWLATLLLLVPWSAADTASTQNANPPPVGIDAEAAASLGERFSSLAAGISFRPPAGGEQRRSKAVGADIVEYVNATEPWSLKVSRRLVSPDMPTVGLNAQGRPAVGDERIVKAGVSDQAVTRLLAEVPGISIVSIELANVGRFDAVRIVSRQSSGGRMWLRQQTLIRTGPTSVYVFDFTSPSAHKASDPPDAADPQEEMAVAIFNAILDSVIVLDQTPVIQDNLDRLHRALALRANLQRHLTRAMRAELCLRVIRDGRDIGWTCLTEELAQRWGEDGLHSTVLSWAQLENGGTLEALSEMHASLNRRTAQEAWATISILAASGTRQTVSEIGTAERDELRRFDDDAFNIDPRDPSQPAVRITERYRLNVTFSQPPAPPAKIQRDLSSQIYIPQAFSQLLARLVPVDQPRGYLFAVWVSSERDVVLRYIDVEREQAVQFAGQSIRAIPVRDRIGLEGDPTIHYLMPDGRYLGCHTPATGISMVACTRDELLRRWPNARLDRPALLD